MLEQSAFCLSFCRSVPQRLIQLRRTQENVAQPLEPSLGQSACELIVW